MMNLRFETIVAHTNLLFAVFFTIFTPLFSVSAQAQTSPPPPAAVKLEKAEMPAPADFDVGDRWEWRQLDDRTKLEEGKRSREVIISTDGVKKFKFHSGRTNNISSAFLGNPTDKKPWRVWPLEVGKTWDYDADWKNPDGLTGDTKQEAKVVAYEEVTVPAGTFMAFKIEYRGFYRNSNSNTGRQNDTYWYAPSVKADVKETRESPEKFTRELINYKRGAP